MSKYIWSAPYQANFLLQPEAGDFTEESTQIQTKTMLAIDALKCYKGESYSDRLESTF
jgi:hypothetical protein